MTKVLFELDTKLVQGIARHLQEYRTFTSRSAFYQAAIADFALRSGISWGDGVVAKVQEVQGVCEESGSLGDVQDLSVEERGQ